MTSIRPLVLESTSFRTEFPVKKVFLILVLPNDAHHRPGCAYIASTVHIYFSSHHRRGQISVKALVRPFFFLISRMLPLLEHRLQIPFYQNSDSQLI